MILLFWNNELGYSFGTPYSVRWNHSVGMRPRCIVNGSDGVSVINPFIYAAGIPSECAYALLDYPCISSDIYNGKIIVGTSGGGLYEMEWDPVTCDISNSLDLSSSIETFSMFSGLLSQDVISVESNGSYLGVMTSSGFCCGKLGEPDFINYATESGKDCFICSNGRTYIADGNRLLVKNDPADFITWDTEYNLTHNINDIWVTEKDGVDTLYVATESGVKVFEQGSIFSYGDDAYSQIRPEEGASINHGHIFALANHKIDVLNLQHKKLEKTISYNNSVFMLFENKRIYSK